MTIRRILVPTNFDEGSTATLKYAVDLASRFRSSVHVLHIVEPAITGRPGVIDGPTAAHRMRAAERRLRKSIPRIAGIQFGVDRDIGVGDPAERIVASAREELADVIVMKSSHTATRESRGPCIVDRVMHAARHHAATSSRRHAGAAKKTPASGKIPPLTCRAARQFLVRPDARWPRHWPRICVESRRRP